jgi:CO/xanthine dehydrogenase Mo-binding subunit
VGPRPAAGLDARRGLAGGLRQLSAELLGLRLDHVRLSLGDTDMPMAPMQGGSGLTAALGGAVQAACRKVTQAFLDAVADDHDSPLRGCRLDDVTAAGGRIHHISEPARGEACTDILARHGLDGGIRMALLEETVTDPATDRIANATVSDYLVSVNADVPDQEVIRVTG